MPVFYGRAAAFATQNKRDFYHGLLGRLTSQIDPRKATNSNSYYYYDRNGNQAKITNRRGQHITFSYDALDRVSARTADAQTTTWTYGQGSEIGRWVQASNSVSTDRFAFDAAGRPVQQTTTRASGTDTLKTNHNNAYGQRESLTISGPSIGPSTTTYGYNARRQLSSFNPGGGNTTFGYYADGLMYSKHLPISAYLYTLHTPSHQSKGVNLNASPSGSMHPADVLGMEYFYGGARIVVERRDDRVNLEREDVEYQYDRAGRLRTYQYVNSSLDPNCQTDCMTTTNGPTNTYDIVGNQGTVTTGNRQVVSPNLHNMEYDADGNMTRKYKTGFDQSFVWNSLGELTRVTTNGVVRDYRYDGLGRWAQTIAGGTTDFVYDGDHILLERTPTGVVTQYNYYPGIDQLHSMNRGGTSYYYVTDPAGTVQGLVDSNQNLVTKFEPWVFGGRYVAQESVVQPFGFQGRPLDRVTGLYNFRARWYDPESERFISEDPIGLAGGINPYVFAENDPVNGRDPTGLYCVKDMWGNLVMCWIPGVTVTVPGGAGGGGAGGGMPADYFTGSGDDAEYHPQDQRWYDLTVAPNFIPTATNPAQGVFLPGNSQAIESPPPYADPVAWLSAGAIGRMTPRVAGSAQRSISTRGGEIRLGNNVRIAPFGNRTGHPLGRLPHYHRRGVGNGQGIGRHRPWESSRHDTSFWSRF